MKVSTREQVLQAFELREQNPEMASFAIARVLGAHKDTVYGWFRKPAMNPYLDPIAIERALKGDVDVYEALTYFEVDEVLTQFIAHRDWIERFPVEYRVNVYRAVDRLVDKLQKRKRRSTGKPAAPPRRCPEFNARCAALRKQGMSHRQIGEVVGAHHSTVARALKDEA